MAEFKVGDIVYHKATLERGVISSIRSDSGELWIVWKSEKKDYHTKEELWTEEEYKERNPEKNRNVKPRGVS